MTDMKKKIRVLVADDHAIVRMGLAALFRAKGDLDVIGQARDGEQAVAEAGRLRPDVVVMDLMMPKLDGADATRRLHEAMPSIPVLILTSFTTSDGIARALAAGAAGAVLKSAENAELVAAIREVANGRRYLSPEIKTLMNTDPPIDDLTERQSEVLHSLTRGLTNRDIARQFGLSVRSVEEHVNHILEKIGAANRAEAVAIALRKHLVKA